jgi:PTS system nitrogen regulatory IIA component
MLQDLFPPDHVLLARLPSQNAVLRELAARSAVGVGLTHSEITHALAQREAFGTTGIGHGIAIPHARLRAVIRPFALFVRLDKPIDWRAIDGQPVDLIFLLLSPEGDAGQHLQTLAAVTRRLRDRKIVDGIRSAHDVTEMRHRLLNS